MPFYKLDPWFLRNFLAADEYYMTDKNNTRHWTIAISHNKVTPWANQDFCHLPLDTLDCQQITREEYFEQFKRYKIMNFTLEEFKNLLDAGNDFTDPTLESQRRYNILELMQAKIKNIMNELREKIENQQDADDLALLKEDYEVATKIMYKLYFEHKNLEA